MWFQIIDLVLFIVNKVPNWILLLRFIFPKEKKRKDTKLVALHLSFPSSGASLTSRRTSNNLSHPWFHLNWHEQPTRCARCGKFLRADLQANSCLQYLVAHLSCMSYCIFSAQPFMVIKGQPINRVMQLLELLSLISLHYSPQLGFGSLENG